MTENQTFDSQFVQDLLRRLDAEYRRAELAESRLAKLSDAQSMEKQYEEQLAAKDKKIEEQKQLLEAQKKFHEEDMAKFLAQVDYLKRKLWGKMSEKRQLPEDPRQLTLDFDGVGLTEKEKKELQDAVEYVENERKTVKVKEHTKQQPVRHKLPEALRRVENHIYPEGYEGHEDEWILFKDTETSEQLEVTAPDIWVNVTIRHKAMRKSDKKVITADCPMVPIPKSIAGVSLLTELIIGKYVDHLPFWRQIAQYKRLGYEIKQPTLESWFHEVASLMRPLYYRIQDIMLSMDYLQSDESTVPVINNEKHRAVKGYMWLVRSIVVPMVFFHYHEGSRNAEVALGFFHDFKGAIQVDGYAGYDVLAKLEGIMIMCCWAHCRRYFDRALKNDRLRAEYGLDQIGMLYSVEKLADEQNMGYEERADLRCRISYPVIRGLEAWALDEYPKVLPKSPIGKALNYLITRIKQLAAYTKDGRYMIDNNPIENCVRPLAIGRKNYMFCGNHDAAEEAAIMYTMMGCCKLAGVDFRKWTTYFLTHIHEYDNDYSKDLADFLPLRLREKGIL